MNFYKEWIQQGKVPPDRTPSVPLNTQPNHPVKVELDDGDVKDELPASAAGLQAVSAPVDSTGSNPEDRGEFPSVSPIGTVSNVQLMRPMADGISAPISQAGEPVSCRVRADTGMSASNNNRRPDDDRFVYLSRDEAIDNDVRVAQIRGDVSVSHNGVPVASESYNDVRTTNTEVRVKGASPPAVREVLRKGTKGRTSSTPSAKFDYSYIRWSNTARTMKSKFDMILEDPPSPSQFNLYTMIESDDASENAEFSNNPAPVFQPKLCTSSRIPNRTMDVGKGQLMPHPRLQNLRSTSLYTRSIDSHGGNACDSSSLRISSHVDIINIATVQ